MFLTCDDVNQLSKTAPQHERRRQEGIQSTSEIGRVLDGLVGTLEAHAYPCKDVFAVRLAVEEALVNAVKHGNGGDPTKCVSICYHVSAKGILVEVEDQGRGFDPDRVPDPLDPENLERPCGRGLLLMRAYMTWVRFSRRGSRVTLYKRRSADARSSNPGCRH
jgi:serine/threonine-protein kinase RsbW